MSLITHARTKEGGHVCGVQNPRRSIGPITFWRLPPDDRCWKCAKALREKMTGAQTVKAEPR